MSGSASPLTSLTIAAPASIAPRVHASGHPELGDRTQHRHHARALHLGIHGRRARPRGLAAEVEEIGALAHELGAAQGRRLDVHTIALHERAAVAEAVGREIDDRHHARPLERQHAVAVNPRARGEPGLALVGRKRHPPHGTATFTAPLRASRKRGCAIRAGVAGGP
jgi:hypothetical protein